MRALERLASLDRRALRLLVLALSASLAMSVPSAGAAATPASTALAADTFSRSADRGWRRADSGGSYTYPAGVSGLSVDGHTGRIVLTDAGSGRSSELRSILVRNVDVRFRVSLERMATGHGVFVAALLRRVDDAEYRARVRFSSTGHVWLSLLLVRHGNQRMIGPETMIGGLRYHAGRSIWVRAQAVGRNPALLRIKAWKAGVSQPAAWQVSRRDRGPDLGAFGRVGVRAYLPSSATRVPVRVHFDDLLVRRVVTASGDPGPDPSPDPTPQPDPTPTPEPDPADAYFVSTSGDDDNPGTSSAPWRTLQYAANNVPAGASVVVRSGTYAGFVVRRSGLEGNPTVFRGSAEGAMPVLDGARDGRDEVVRLNGVHDIRVQGFVITGAQGGNFQGAGVHTEQHASSITIAGNVIRDNHSFGVYAQTSTDITIRDNEITGNEAGVYVSYAGGGTRILDNRIHHNDKMIRNTTAGGDDAGAVGIVFHKSTGSVVASGNRIWGNRARSHDYGWDGGAFEIYGASNVTMSDNVMWDNENVLETGTDQGGLACANNAFVRNVAYGATTAGRNFGLFLRCATDMLVAYNTIEGLTSWAFSIGGDSARYSGGVDGLRLVGNVVDMSATGGKIYGIVKALPDSVRIDYDLVFTTGSVASLPDGRSTRSLETFTSWTGFNVHGASSDPRFDSANNHDYQLRSGSPAIDAGVSVSGVSDTWSGAAPDLGRFELTQ